MGSVCEVYWTRIPRRSLRFRSQRRACSKTWTHPRITSAGRSERKANSFLRNSLPGTAQKSFGGGGESVLGPGSAYNQGRQRRREGKELQARTGGAGQGFRDDGDAVPRFDGGDEAADAVVLLRDARFGFDRGEQRDEIFMSFGIICAAVGNERLPAGFRQRHRAPPGQRVLQGNREAHRVARQLFKMQSPQHGSAQAHDESEVQVAFAQTGEHFLGGEVMQTSAHVGQLGLKGTQRGRQNPRGERRRVTDVEFARAAVSYRPRRLNRLFRALQDRAGFSQERATGRRQAHGFGAALQQQKAEFSLQVAHLAAQRWLRDVQPQCSPRNVLLLGDGDEAAEVAQFHIAESSWLLADSAK